MGKAEGRKQGQGLYRWGNKERLTRCPMMQSSESGIVFMQPKGEEISAAPKPDHPMFPCPRSGPDYCRILSRVILDANFAGAQADASQATKGFCHIGTRNLGEKAITAIAGRCLYRPKHAPPKSLANSDPLRIPVTRESLGKGRRALILRECRSVFHKCCSRGLPIMRENGQSSRSNWRTIFELRDFTESRMSDTYAVCREI